jgi:hypothetical protein
VSQKKHMRCLSLWSSCPFTHRGSLFTHWPSSLPPSSPKKENCAKTSRSLCTHSVLHRNHDWITSMIPMKVQELGILIIPCLWIAAPIFFGSIFFHFGVTNRYLKRDESSACRGCTERSSSWARIKHFLRQHRTTARVNLAPLTDEAVLSPLTDRAPFQIKSLVWVEKFWVCGTTFW